MGGQRSSMGGARTQKRLPRKGAFSLETSAIGQGRLKVLGRPLRLLEAERGSQDAGSDAELPEGIHLTVTPCGTARHRVL